MSDKRILLIEDDDLVRETITDLLELSGYAVDSAINGKYGLEKILDRIPDLVICDIMMPEMDGFELLSILKEKELMDNMYFMFLSAKSRESDLQKGLEMGADDYMIKPFRNMDLIDKVEDVLGT